MCTSLLNLVFLYKWRCWSILSPFNFLKQLVHLFYLLINLSFFTLILLVIFLFFEKFLKALSKRLFKLFCYLLVLDLCLHPLYLHHTWVSWHLLLILTLPSISSWFQFFLYTVFLNILFLVFIPQFSSLLGFESMIPIVLIKSLLMYRRTSTRFIISDYLLLNNIV